MPSTDQSLCFTVETGDAAHPTGTWFAKVQHWPTPGGERKPNEYGTAPTRGEAIHIAIRDMLARFGESESRWSRFSPEELWNLYENLTDEKLLEDMEDEFALRGLTDFAGRKG